MPSRSKIDKRRKKASSAKKVHRKKVVRRKTAKKPAAKKPAKRVRPIASSQQTRWLSVAVVEGNEIQAAKSIGRVKCVVQVLLPVHDGSALYPGYVFSECDFSDDVLTYICQLADVEGILSKDGICNYAMGGREAPVELEPEALRSIRESETRYAKIVRNEMTTTVEKGQKITITSGVFGGMSGHVISINRRKMSVIAKVRLSDGGMVRKVSVKYGQFEAMEGEDDGWRL